jgi:hypothetical protein
MAMSRRTQPASSSAEPSIVEQLIARGAVRPPKRSLADLLARRGPMTGRRTRAGTRALKDLRSQRG